MAEMLAGPEMDALVSKVVFGRAWRKWPYAVINETRYDLETWLPDGKLPDNPPGGSRAGMTPPQYSTDIARAWLVVERMTAGRGYYLLLLAAPDGYATASFYHGPEDHQATTERNAAPLAICRAALAALAVQS